MDLVKEENNEISLLVPKCQKCDLIMSGFWWKFYKDPSFSDTEIMSAFFWTEIFFQCPKCHGKAHLSQQELDKVNSYPMDKVNFPPGFDPNKLKYQRLTSR
jgi:hypothetical protein